MLHIGFIFLVMVSFLLISCSSSIDNDSQSSADDKYALEYKGLYFYTTNIPASNYRLAQLSNADFNALNEKEKLVVADKLLSSMFFAFTPPLLEEKILSGTFISAIKSGLDAQVQDIASLEETILIDEQFRQDRDESREISNILARFYLMDSLDSYYYNNWIAYMLTQTIMFSPANELESTSVPNIARVYNRIVTLLDEEATMRYITYMHMISEDNWRRFRSPEDNGREMLEIFTLDADDANVPLAGKALQNWRLDRDGNTLVIGLNENTEPVRLFGTQVTNGDDFYRELAKSQDYTIGVVKRIVDFMFTSSSDAKKVEVMRAILSSSPESFQDIFTQILFSKEYLLSTSRAKSIEELFFPIAKKTSFKHYRNTFYKMENDLDDMHQASMKYKLGKLDRVPLDTLSFATSHSFIRDEILLRRSNNDSQELYENSNRQGWSDPFIAYENFNYDETLKDESVSLDALIQYLFNAIVMRDASQEELDMFNAHMFANVNGEEVFVYYYDMFVSDSNATRMFNERESRKGTITLLVLDYLSRLDALYMFKEVK